MFLPPEVIGIVALILCLLCVCSLVYAKRTNADERAWVLGIALGAFAYLSLNTMLGVFSEPDPRYLDRAHFTQVLCIIMFGILAFDALFILADLREGKRLREEIAEQEELKRRMEYERKRHRTGMELPS